MLIMLTGNSVPVLLFPITLGILKQTEQLETLPRTSVCLRSPLYRVTLTAGETGAALVKLAN